MLIIAEVSKDINATMQDSEKYIGKAIEKYHSYPRLAEVYFMLYKNHKAEIMQLHEQALQLIKENDNSNVDKVVLDTMKKIWDFQHMEMMERMGLLDVKERRYTEMKKK